MNKWIAFLLVLIFKAGIAQQDYATLHFIARTTYPPLLDQSLKLMFNDQLATNVRYGEAIHYKIYSEGRIALSREVILDVKNGNDYYAVFQVMGKNPFSVKQELKILDSLEWKTLKQECKFEADMEEDKRYPWGKLNQSKVRGPGSGTCFAIAKNGYLVTNYHVIDGAKEITVKGIDGDLTTKYGVTLVSADKSNDLALLKIGNKNITFDSIPYAIRSSGVAQGEKIYAYGYPLTTAMGNEIKLTDGIISARSGVEGDISKFQVSAAVQPGNSGGPLIDEQGNVIGVIYAKSTVADAASYAVKASYLETFLKNVDGFEFPNYVNTIKDKPLTDKVAKLRDYIFIVETN